MGIKVGTNNGYEIFISERSPNQHVLLTGISGSGKTTRFHEMELDALESGKNVIELDISQSHSRKRMQFGCETKNKVRIAKNRINVLDDGLNLSLLHLDTEPSKEKKVETINSVTRMLLCNSRKGCKQERALRDAVRFALKHRDQFGSDLMAIYAGLHYQSTEAAAAVIDDLWPLLTYNVLRNSEKRLVRDKVIIISFDGIDEMTQKILSEIFLSCFWWHIRNADREPLEFVLVLDEFQHFSLREGSSLREMLREGRKFGLGVLLATQTLNVFSKEEVAIINQAATKLYFKPGANEVRKIAKEIDPKGPDEWVEKLSKLQQGACVAVGNLRVNDMDIFRPVILR